MARRPTAGVPPDGKERRHKKREPFTHFASLNQGGTRIPVVLEDISGKGVRLKLSQRHKDCVFDGSQVLEVPGLMKLPVDLRWREGGELGAAFDLPGPRLGLLEPQIKRMVSRGKSR